MCEQYLSPSVYLLVKNNVVNKERSKSGHRYSKQIKQFALTIYFLSPIVFNFLQKTFSSFYLLFSFLKIVTSQYYLKPGLNDFLFHFLEFKMSSFHPDALDCFLCADEMLIKQNLFYYVTKVEIIGFNQSAKYTLVLILRGIKYNWKQLIAY